MLLHSQIPAKKIKIDILLPETKPVSTGNTEVYAITTGDLIVLQTVPIKILLKTQKNLTTDARQTG
jgi:hypothetical protein